MTDYRQTGVWKRVKRVVLDPTRRLAANAVFHDRIPLAWCEGRNWGDALSPILVKLLSGKKVFHAGGLHYNRYLVIGSILGDANERAEIWGSGFIREGQTVARPPKAVHAVRGPLSRQMLMAQGIHCPEVFGDPALLLPMFFDPEVPKRHAIGVIPHYIDKNRDCILACQSDPSVLVIDIESGIEDFVRAVKSCDVVLSSSLHGLICADAYGVPRSWIKLSDAVYGGDFKFRDYGLSVGQTEPLAMNVGELGDIYLAARAAARIEVRVDISRLLLSCPFLSDELRVECELRLQHQTPRARWQAVTQTDG